MLKKIHSKQRPEPGELRFGCLDAHQVSTRAATMGFAHLLTQVQTLPQQEQRATTQVRIRSDGTSAWNRRSGGATRPARPDGFDIVARNGVCAAPSWIIPRTCHRLRSVALQTRKGIQMSKVQDVAHRDTSKTFFSKLLGQSGLLLECPIDVPQASSLSPDPAITESVAFHIKQRCREIPR